MYHFKGKRGAEHYVRSEWPTGAVDYYEGKAGAEHLVRTKRCLSHGDVVTYFKGKRGAEHYVRREHFCAAPYSHTTSSACTNHRQSVPSL